MNIFEKFDKAIYNLCENYYNGNVTEIEFLANLDLLEVSTKISREQILQRYNWLKMLNINPNIIDLEENHKIIYRIFDELNLFLNNNNINYYYTSGILAFTIVNRDLERYHHDLDLFISMKDLERLEELSSMSQFEFRRELGDRGDGTKRIMLKLYHREYGDIPITIFMLVNELNGEITQRDYYFDKSGELMIENIHNSKRIVELSFSKEPYYHNGISYNSITLEALYLCKVGNRPKDIYDCSIFENKVNFALLKELDNEFKSNKPNDIVDTLNDQYREFMLKGLEKSKSLVLL